jgi:hypothetical protein
MWEYGLGRAICTGTTRTGRITAQCVNVNVCGLICNTRHTRTMIKIDVSRNKSRKLTLPET